MPLKNLTTLEQRLALLVAMPTETRRREANRQAINSLAEELKSLGLFVNKYSGVHPSLVATTKKTKKPAIMLVSHIDVVPAASPTDFEPKFTATKIFARGVWDMKFAAACYLEFLHEYSENLGAYDIGVMFTTDEEQGSLDGTLMLLADQGYRCKVAIIPDSVTPWHIQDKAKGRMEIDLKATGRSTHGSRPWDGINAIDNLNKVFAYIQKKYPVENPDDDTVVITKIEGGTAGNVIPAQATATLDVRSYSSKRLVSIKKSLDIIARKYDIECAQIHFREPVKLDKNNAHVKLFSSVLGTVTGKPVQYNGACGASDASYFERYNMPAIVISINGGGQHADKEHIMRKDLPLFYEMLVTFIQEAHNFAGKKPAPNTRSRNLLKRMLSKVGA